MIWWLIALAAVGLLGAVSLVRWRRRVAEARRRRLEVAVENARKFSASLRRLAEWQDEDFGVLTAADAQMIDHAATASTDESDYAMRDPDRIDLVLDEIRRVWEANPDLRLSQLVFNAARAGLSGTDAPLPLIPPRLYNIEEPLLLDGLRRL